MKTTNQIAQRGTLLFFLYAALYDIPTLMDVLHMKWEDIIVEKRKMPTFSFRFSVRCLPCIPIRGIPVSKKNKNNHMMTLSYFWGYAFCFPFYSFSFKCRGSSAQSVACFSNENLLIQHWPSLASNCVNFGQVYWKVFGQPYLTRENACDVFLFVELKLFKARHLHPSGPARSVTTFTFVAFQQTVDGS